MKKIGLLLTFLVISALSVDAATNSQKITKANFGADWPFTVNEGTLSCDSRGPGFGAITFTIQKGKTKKTYPVNGLAKSVVKTDIAEIWANNPSIPGAKKNIGRIIQAGLKLCK